MNGVYVLVTHIPIFFCLPLFKAAMPMALASEIGMLMVSVCFFPQSWSRMGDPILHIELRRWADILLIAPCSANTLSKLASGACDNLVVRFSSLPL